MKRPQCTAIAILLLTVLITSYSASGQSSISLRVDDVENTSFPNLTLNITAVDNKGYPLPGLSKDSFSLSEENSVITDFTITPINQHPIQVVIALDISGSMEYGLKPTPLQSSISAIQEFLAGLGLQDQAAIITFSDQVVIRQELTNDLTQAQTALSGLVTSSNTALNDALYMSSMILQGQGFRPVIILITDGKDSGVSQRDFAEVIQAITQLRGIVFPIGWGGASRNNLQQLADLTHGEAQYLTGQYPDQAQFYSAFSRIQDLITEYRTQYQLSFKSSLPADGQEHELAVGLDYLGLHIETTRRFVATQGEVHLTFSSLNEGQSVSGKVTLAPQFDAPAAIELLEIMIDGQPLTSLLAEPFVFEWDSSLVLPGEHLLSFKARDRAGNTGETSLNLNVVKPIEVVITSPRNGENFKGPKLISANVIAQTKISRVEFLIDGRLLEQVENPPYEVNWSTIGAGTGAHEIKVTAYDANNYSAESRVIVNIIEKGRQDWIIPLAITLGAAALIIPIGLRLRKRKSKIQGLAEPMDENPLVLLPLASGRVILREIDGLNPQHEWNLSETDEIILGRKRDTSDIPLKGETASRQHLVIRYQDGVYILYNLKPENPPLVNGNPIIQDCKLNPQDTIQVGESLFQFDIQV